MIPAHAIATTTVLARLTARNSERSSVMAIYPWRFQADVAMGEVDPMVTLFVGPERHVLDDNGEPTIGETFVQQDTSNPVQLKLSELPAALADPSTITRLRQKPA